GVAEVRRQGRDRGEDQCADDRVAEARRDDVREGAGRGRRAGGRRRGRRGPRGPRGCRGSQAPEGGRRGRRRLQGSETRRLTAEKGEGGRENSLSISAGSLSELDTLIELGQRPGYFD